MSGRVRFLTVVPSPSWFPRGAGSPGRNAASVLTVRGDDMDIAQLLTNTGRHLASQGTTAGDLAVLEFAADGSGIVMRAGVQPPRSPMEAEDYPGLDILLAGIGRTLRDAGTELHQLRRIRFFEEHVGIELVDTANRPVTYLYPILREATDVPSPPHARLTA